MSHPTLRHRRSFLVLATIMLAAMATPPAAGTPGVGDVENLVHCSRYFTYNLLQFLNGMLQIFWDSPYGREIQNLKCQAWRTACLGGLAQPYQFWACKLTGGAGIVNSNNCYTILRLTGDLGVVDTYYHGNPQSLSAELDRTRAYWYYYETQGWDYPSWLIPETTCEDYLLFGVSGTWVWRETNGLAGLQGASVIHNGRTYPRDELYV